jgi:hypothetical protein
VSVKTLIRIECDSPGCDRGYGPVRDLTTAEAIRRSDRVPFEYHEDTDRDYCEDHAPLRAAVWTLMMEGFKADDEREQK